MINCVSVEQMRKFDKQTIETETSSIELMYRAAYAVYEQLDLDGKIYIICGSGNNGGDGIALCNIMAKNGFKPMLYLISNKFTIESQYYYDELIDMGYKNIFSIDKCDYNADTIVDCIFGTGFKGEVVGSIANIIKNINVSRAYVVSVDIPSGLNGDNGTAQLAVNANKTVAIEFAKIGHVINDGKDYTGELTIKDIGIKATEKTVKIIEKKDINCFTKRKHNSHKGTYGKSVIIGGSANYVGAVKIANYGTSALRCGAGLNVVAVPKSIMQSVSNHVIESTLYPLSENDGKLIFNESEIKKLLVGATGVAIGMGMGDNYIENKKIIQYIVTNYDIPVLIDADGLNSLQGDLDILKNSKAKILITPHPKEFSRLTGIELKNILLNPINSVLDAIGDSNITILLKGTSTIVANKEAVYLVTNGGPELAKGGSGDTLSGAILGLLAQGIEIDISAYTGAYLCAEAASNCVKDYTEYGVLASDVGKALKSLIQ